MNLQKGGQKMNYKIFLCCGAGMSSGFLAQSMRKSAKKRKVMATIEAASQSDVDSYIDDMDLLLVGPHMSYVFDELRNKAESCGKKMTVIPEEIYGNIDGEALLDFAIDILENK